VVNISIIITKLRAKTWAT